MGTEPDKRDILKSCLERSFKGVGCTEDPTTLATRFLFNDLTQRYELTFTTKSLDDFRGDLKAYVEETLLPKLKENPGKIIYVCCDGIGIRDMIQ